MIQIEPIVNFGNILTNNKPEWLVELNEKLSTGFLDQNSLGFAAKMFAASRFFIYCPSPRKV